MLNRYNIKQTVIVEGLHDKAILESVINGTIIYVNGFSIFKDKPKLALIRRYAESNGIILLTDSDNAGRQIRDFLKNYLNGCEVHHIYVPNLLEVEDTAIDVLQKILDKFNGQLPTSHHALITRERLFDDGLIGSDNSSKKRKELLKLMDLPENLSVTALLDVLNRCGSDDYERFVKEAVKLCL